MKHPLNLSLASRTPAMTTPSGISLFLNPGLIYGANPYALPGMYTKAQPLYSLTSITGANVSTTPVLYTTAGERIANNWLSASSPFYDQSLLNGTNPFALPGMYTYASPLHQTSNANLVTRPIVKTTDGEEIPDNGLFCPAPVNIEEEENRFIKFFEDAGDLAVDAGEAAYRFGKDAFEFLVWDDVETLADPEASAGEKVEAGVSFIPVGKILKGAKVGGELLGIRKVDDVADKVKETVDKVSNGNHYTKGKNVLPRLSPLTSILHDSILNPLVLDYLNHQTLQIVDAKIEPINIRLKEVVGN